MNWTDILNQFQSQGSIFWIAAGSIAAGATLLLVSGVVMAKRGIVKGWLAAWKMPRKRLSRRPRFAQTQPQVEITETGYKANTLTTAAPSSPPVEISGCNLKDLHRRLQVAANTLEEVKLALGNTSPTNGISGLKASQRDVEYVFKTGIG